MSVDMEKYRKNSSFYRTGAKEDYERNMIIGQAIDEFDVYQRYAPNTHTIYINDDPTPVLATMQDVSDLEVRADTKWMATSLRHKVYAGDILTWNGRKWIVVYDKVKNTQNCYKVKIQPCNYSIQFAYFDKNKNPQVCSADSIIMTFLTDTKDFKQPFPTEVGTTFASVQFNEITNLVKRGDRIYLFDSPFDVVGIDFTNIDFYCNKGFLKWTLRPSLNNTELDNPELKICDYYKYFPKPTNIQPIVPNTEFSIVADKKTIKPFESASIQIINNPNNDKMEIAFEGSNIHCMLKDITNDGCKLQAGSDIGFVYVKAYKVSQPNIVKKVRVIIAN